MEGFNLDFGTMNKKEAVFEPGTVYDTIVIGYGPAGMNAAIYLKRKGMNVGIIGSKPGGQVADTSTVENYLGYTMITGEGLVNEFQKHVGELEIPVIMYYGVTGVEKGEDGIFNVACDDEKTYKAKTLVIATGSSPRKLGVPGEAELYGRGVTYCAICDGPLYKGADVVVAGGGNTAVEAAIDLSKICNSVYLVHRSTFRADKIVLEKMKETENISYTLGTVIESINGENGVDSVTVKDKETGEVRKIAAEGVFVEIGHTANTAIFKDLLELNESGEIIVDDHMATSVPGIYAAGDVTTEPFKQIIIAASSGAKAALSLNEYFMKNFSN